MRCFRDTSALNQSYLRSFLPPMQAPNASAHTRGCNGKSSSRFCARFIAILTIIVVSGTLSTKALANAETHSNSRIATANRDSSLTDKMKFSVCLPIQSMRPRRERACRIFVLNFAFNRFQFPSPRHSDLQFLHCFRSRCAITRNVALN